MRTLTTTQTLKPRGLMATLMFLLAAVLAVTLIAMTFGAGEATAGGRGKTYTNTSQLTVNYGATASSTITVKGGSPKVTDVNVTLRNLSSGRPADLQVYLVAPNGFEKPVMSGAGGFNQVTSITFTLDDQAANSLPYDLSGVLEDGKSYQSYDLGLSGFNGTNRKGTWKLQVHDVETTGSSSQIAGGWSLTLS